MILPQRHKKQDHVNCFNFGKHSNPGVSCKAPRSSGSSGASYPSIKVLILRSEDDATRADKVAITISGCMPDVFEIDD
ncbi:hypothetical protein V1522DRAFT_415628, partial [Lipomyces starkeyi]